MTRRAQREREGLPLARHRARSSRSALRGGCAALLLLSAGTETPAAGSRAPGRGLESSVQAPGEIRWNETATPHFLIRHEAAFTPQGFSLFLEKLHNRLRLDLSMFSPWMVNERVNLYLYKTDKSFFSGEFKPPSWSNGLALYEKKTVVVHDQADKKKLFEIIAHESTHLLFESYWGEVRKTPPHWLNEGLAMMEETDRLGDNEASDWYQSMSMLPSDRLIALDALTKAAPTRDIKDKQTVVFWYVESYSLVYFLYQRHTRLQFRNFCGRLRDGKSLQEAVWDAYRFRDVRDLETAWKQWLAETFHGKTAARHRSASPRLTSADPGAPAESSPGLKPVTLRVMSFHGLREDADGN